ncbi:MAG: amidohydrolase family protein [Myxococcales bacterium]|nr:amidohydrolase family protein [Myxococcales bacterium]
MPRLAAALCLLAVGCSRCAKEPASPPRDRPHKVDAHTHFPPEATARVIALMDQYGLDAVVNLSGGTPGRGLEAQVAAAERYPGRIFVFANLDWRHTLLGPGYGERMAEDLIRAKAAGAKGLKIPKALGLAIQDAQGALLPVDDPGLDPVFDRAAELSMPVSIHVGDPVAFWLPPTPANERFDELSVHPGWSYFGESVPTWDELLGALERRIARHPKTTFISVHFGNAPEYPERVSELLDRYPNLYVDTAARVPEIGRYPAEKMRALFEKHQDRILFGTDLGVGVEPSQLMLGSTGATPPTRADADHFFRATWRYFETADRAFPHPTPIQGRWTIDGISLPGDVLEKVYGGNAQRLLGLR